MPYEENKTSRARDRAMKETLNKGFSVRKVGKGKNRSGKYEWYWKPS